MDIIKSKDFNFLRELNLNHKAESTNVKEFIVKMDTQRWLAIKESKERFLRYGDDPHNSPCMYPEIADSWIRSKKYGVDPYQKKLGFIMKPKDLHTLILDKWDLVNITNTFMLRNLGLLSLSGFLMCLTDENGVLLLSAGAKSKVEYFEAINAVPGAVWTEREIGTNCHSMCINLQRPVQIMGPYYYCDIVYDNLGSGTPIMDDNGKLLGVLLVVTDLTPDKQIQQTNLLSWVISAGLAIENKLKLQRQIYLLSLSDTFKNFNGEFNEKGCIILNKEKYIYYIDRQMAENLDIPRKEAIDQHYSEVLKLHYPIENLLNHNEPIYNSPITIDNGTLKLPYYMNIEPIFAEENQGVNGFILTFFTNSQEESGQDWHEKDQDPFSPIIGNSESLRSVIHKARKFACHDGSILLQGESGTGKEIFAKAIHEQSKRTGSFIAINCASIPKSLIESELFGYEGGAFTGAERRGRVGKIELAKGGTLFLDEIGDMPLEVQAVLLRVLEDKKIMRVGGTKYISVDFKIISATNKDLKKMVLKGEFREDLYFRLAVFKLTIPPLASRDDDVIKLAEYFVEKECRKDNIKNYPQLSTEVCDLFINYNWPGNVRQLENVITYSLAMSSGRTIKIAHLPEDLQEAIKYNKLMPKNEDPKFLNQLSNIEKIEMEAIKEALKKSGNNVTEVAEILGLGRSTVYRKIKQYGIKT